MFHRVRCLLVNLLIAVLLTVPAYAQTQGDAYAYLIYDSASNAYHIDAVQPEDNMRVINVAELSAPPETRLGLMNPVPSPDGAWLASFWKIPDTHDYLIQFLNLLTGDTDTTDLNFNVDLLSESDNVAAQLLGWSSDGHYFAWSHVDPTDQTYQVSVYDTQQRQQWQVASQLPEHFRVAWSHDGQYLATIGSTCDNNGCDRAALEIFDIATTSLAYSVNVTDLALNTAMRATTFCMLNWSPEDKWIALVNLCDPTALSGTKEVLVANLSDQTLIQATHFTPDTSPADTLFLMDYATAWLDTTTLLISYEKRTGVFMGTLDPLEVATVLFDAATQTTQPFLEERTGEWVGTADAQWGYISYVYPTSLTKNSFSDSVVVKIGSFADGQMTHLADRDSGCHLAWNASGSLLAYLPKDTPAVIYCFSDSEIVHFVDRQGNLLVHQLKTPITALGWITLP